MCTACFFFSLFVGFFPSVFQFLVLWERTCFCCSVGILSPVPLIKGFVILQFEIQSDFFLEETMLLHAALCPYRYGYSVASERGFYAAFPISSRDWFAQTKHLKRILSVWFVCLERGQESYFWELEKQSNVLCLDYRIPKSFFSPKNICLFCMCSCKLLSHPPAVENKQRAPRWKPDCESYVASPQLFWSCNAQPKTQSRSI